MNKILYAVIGILVIAGAVFLLSNQTKKTNVAATPTPSASTSANPSPSAMEERKITVTKNGFEPQTLTVKVGTKVTFVNNSGDTISVNSDPHPTHTLFPILNIGIINDGASASITFDKAGTYTYHNHLDATQRGTIIVQ